MKNQTPKLCSQQEFFSLLLHLVLLPSLSRWKVWKGLYKQSNHSYLVAIKTLHGALQADRDEILRESCIMAQFDHPHIGNVLRRKVTTGRTETFTLFRQLLLSVS
jgi:hypothetical protein